MALRQLQQGGAARIEPVDLPAALHPCRHGPEITNGLADPELLVGLPVTHGEGVRQDARAGSHRQQGGAKPLVEFFEQVQGDHRGRREVLLEDVSLHELHLVLHARLQGLAPCQIDQPGVVFDAPGPCAKLPCSRNRNAAVTGAQVHHRVFGRDTCHVQHVGDQIVSGGQPHHILAHLTQSGRVAAGSQAAAPHQPEYQAQEPPAGRSVHQGHHLRAVSGHECNTRRLP